MKKIKKQKIKRFFIVVIALLLILLGVMFFMEGKSKEKSEGFEQLDPSNEEEPANNEEEPNSNEETPAENEEEPLNEQEPVSEETEETEETEVVEGSEDYKEIVADPSAYDVLVNKTKNLSDSYVPDDLVSLDDVPTVLKNPEVNQLREAAYVALKDFFQAAKNEAEYELYARSGYRSYNTQAALYKSYVSNNGQSAADKYSAKPGQSEHQTGLSIDITCAALNYLLDDTFADAEEGKWVAENAHRFGFIVRYPKGKEDITGYFYEPWHIRYLGIELSTKVYESGLTLEEYMEQ